MENQQGFCGSAATVPSITDPILKPKTEKIRRPPNAFMLFAKEHRKNVAKRHPNVSNKVVSSLLGKIWKDTPNEIKIQYFTEARMLDELHKRRYPDYIYSPRVARLQKMRRKRKSNAVNTTDSYTVIKNEKHEGEVFDESWKMDENVDSVSSSEYVPNNPEYFIPQSPEMLKEGDSNQLLLPDQCLPSPALHQTQADEVPINMEQPKFPMEANSGWPTAPEVWDWNHLEKLESRNQCCPLCMSREVETSPHFSDHFQYPSTSFCNSSANFSGPMSSAYYEPRPYPSSMPGLSGSSFHGFWDPSQMNPHSFQSKESVYENLKPFTYAEPYNQS